MILYDPALITVFTDYGIMLPLEASRGQKVIDFLDNKKCFPGPVLDIKAALSLLGEDEKTAMITKEDVQKVHSVEYSAALFDGEADGRLERGILEAYELYDADGKPNRYEPENARLPLSLMFKTILKQLTGSYLACLLALSTKDGAGFCYYLGGGNHHSRYAEPAGFCLLNDVVIAARKIQFNDYANLVWIIDVDAHKGCGSAELVSFMRNRTNPKGFKKGQNIFTLSIHMAQGWPLDGDTLKNAVPGRAPLIPSDVEIPVESGCEGQYSELLKNGIERLEKLSENKLPDLAIVVDGADPYIYDALPSSNLLRLTLDQCLERDNLIYNYLKKNNISSAWIMAGGYGDRAYEPPAHFLNSIRTAKAAEK